MTALKKILAVMFLTLLICAPNVEAADKPKVMVMDCRIFADPAANNEYDGVIDDRSKDLTIKALINSSHFIIMDSEFALIQKELEFAELFPEIENSDLPDSAKEVDYLIYGDNFIEVVRKGEKFQSVKCTTILYLWNAKTERIVTAAKGEGIYKRSEIDADDLKNLGKNKVPLISISNATYRAANDAVDKLIKKIFES